VTAAFEGGCLCGAVRFSCAREPSLVSYCHCRMCQKVTGSAFSVMANFPTPELVWTGRQRKLYRSSPLAVRGFCPECGTPLSFQYGDSPHTSVAVGALDDPERVRPMQHGGIESRVSWLELHDDLPRERTDDDPDYRHLLEVTAWKPPTFGR
jgi:hypothetical protein